MLSEIIKSEMSKVKGVIDVRVNELKDGNVIIHIKESKYDYIGLVGKYCVGNFDVREFSNRPMEIDLELVLIEEIVMKNSKYASENIWIMVDENFKKI